MASLFGDNGGTYAGGRRRTTNAGYPPASTSTSTRSPFDTAIPRTPPNGTGGSTGTGTGTDTGGDTTTPGTGPGPWGSPTTGFPGPTGTPTPTPTPAPAPWVWGNVPGLDSGKLGNLDYHSYKYGNAARAVSSFLGSGGKFGRNDFDALIQWAKTNWGLPNAHATSDDKVDFGDGSGPIDLILGNGGYWWGQEDPGFFSGSATDPTKPSPPQPGLPDPPATTNDPGGAAAGAGGGSANASYAALLQLLQGLTRQPAAATSGAGTTTSPTFSGGYATTPAYGTGYGGTVGHATQTMALSLQDMLRDPRYANDPLVQSILRLVMGGM